ncbi:MAG: hypothetical protein AAFN41_01875, partial [Planctomycetota bacterium]
MELTIPGVVQAWAEQDVAFEISGRIDYVVQEGVEVRGRWEENGEVLVTGDLLARIDQSDFEAAVAAAQADLDTAIIQRDRVAPAEVAEAEASRDQANDELQRVEEANRQGATSVSELVSARANADVAEARVAAARAGLSSAEASVIRAEAALDQARLDLARTELWAPFGAEVSGRSQNVGGYASPGSPVVHLTMIDPIEVAVQVSAATSREIAVNDRMRVFVD